MSPILPRALNRIYHATTGTWISDLQSTSENLGGSVQALQSLSAPLDIQPLLEAEDQDSKDLGELFKKYGSDKSTRHDYYRLYAHIVKRDAKANILEIGLGTNNTSFTSNMGKDGKPGASLRAFRDWGKNFEVYGAEIDREVLFEEDRIKTYFVDQTKPETLADLAKLLPAQFDLIIDDGLHTSQANLNTLNFALPLLKPGATFIVEDILERYLPVWRIAYALLKDTYDCKFIQCKKEILFVLKNN